MGMKRPKISELGGAVLLSLGGKVHELPLYALRRELKSPRILKPKEWSMVRLRWDTTETRPVYARPIGEAAALVGLSSARGHQLLHRAHWKLIDQSLPLEKAKGCEWGAMWCATDLATKMKLMVCQRHLGTLFSLRLIRQPGVKLEIASLSRVDRKQQCAWDGVWEDD